MKQMRQKTIANMGDSHTLLEELLQRERSANDHDDDRHDQRCHVQAHDGGAGSVAEEHDVHDGGEDEGRDVVGEVTHHAEISDRTSAKDGTKHATRPISTISTVRRIRYFLEEMKTLPCSTSSPSIVSLMGSIHSGKPPTTVNHIIRFSSQPSAKPSGSDVMMLSCTPFSAIRGWRDAYRCSCSTGRA